MHSLRKLDEVALSLHQFEDDKGGQRTGIKRRQFLYSCICPKDAVVSKGAKNWI